MLSNLTLNDYQKLIAKLSKKRGFDDETVPEKFMLLIEEIGELAKATRKDNGIKVSKHSSVHNIEEESADIFWLLLDICNKLEINLGKAFAKKESVNLSRDWT